MKYIVLLLCVWLPSLALAQAVQSPVELRFDIRRFIVEGNTILPQGEVERVVAPFTGPGRDFGDVQGPNILPVLVPPDQGTRVNVPSQLLNTLIQGGTVGKGGELECKIQ